MTTDDSLGRAILLSAATLFLGVGNVPCTSRIDVENGPGARGASAGVRSRRGSHGSLRFPFDHTRCDAPRSALERGVRAGRQRLDRGER